MKESRTRFRDLIGPGFITGAADDDPSGIATYSQVGAQFGFQMLWTVLFSLPFMMAMQEISARIGLVTGHGIAGNIRRTYPKWLLYGVVTLLVTANVLNLGADLGAIGETARLVFGGNALLYVVVAAAISVLLEVAVPYQRYSPYLKWLTLALFAYVGTIFTVEIPWRETIMSTLIPQLTMSRAHILAFIAIIGTTISPYMFFWQASEEVEELHNHHPFFRALRRCGIEGDRRLRMVKWDTDIGMAFSNIISFFIVLTAAVTLHSQGVTTIESAAQAAEALRPVAGNFAFLLFSLGIIGTGMLAIPVLAGSAAYAVGEALEWPVGLDRKPLRAKGFYTIIAAATVIGMLLNFTAIDPFKALFAVAVFNGLISVPLIIVMVLICGNRSVMGKWVISNRLRWMGFATAAVMTLAGLGLILAT